MLKRISLISIGVLCILLVVGCGTNTNLTPPPDEEILLFGEDNSLEVVSWNLRTFPINEQSIQTIASIIPQIKADIIAFQEIMDYSSFYELADAIPFYEAYVYSATSTYRLAYLYDSRVIQVTDVYTIMEEETNPFPRAPYVMEAMFQDKDVIIIDNHLKAYGDNYIDESDPWDEEFRRRLACQMLDQYIAESFPNDRVIVVGDFNDQIAEPIEYNVFQCFIDKPGEYIFADMDIALNPSYESVSYPSSNSHIDHILLSNELFDAFDNSGSQCKVIRVEEYLGSWQNYSDQVSDHRPIGVKLFF